MTDLAQGVRCAFRKFCGVDPGNSAVSRVSLIAAGERSGLRLAFGKAVVDETELDVPFDHAATLEQPEDTHAGSVQEVCDVRAGQ